MTKILIISAVFPPEPVVSAGLSFDLATAMSGYYDVTVISPTPSRPLGYNFRGIAPTENSFSHIILNSYVCPESSLFGRFKESFSFGKACYSFIKNLKDKPDCIYMNTWPLAAQYWVLKAARKSEIPVIVHIQDIYPESLIQKLPVFRSFFQKMLLPIDKSILYKSRTIVTISESMKKFLVTKRGISPIKIKVVYNWQDEKKFLDITKNKYNHTPDSQTHFMFLGSLGPVANVDNLIRAFAMVKNEAIRLTIAGEGSEKISLQKLAQDIKETRIEFISAPASDAGKIQEKASILLLSLKKGAAGLALPSKLPAYMFSAKPIIATVDLDSDTAKAIREAGCGWVIEPENPAALSELMQKIITMPEEEFQSMGLKGREYALKHFSKEANLSKLVGIIEKTIKK